MSQVNCRITPYGEKRHCRAWCLFLKENWTPGSPNYTSPKEQRTELLKRWEHAQQDFRDIYVQRAIAEPVEPEREDYHPDIPTNDFRRNLDQYPCVRVHFDQADTNTWEKLKLFLKLDEQLSPLDAEELPLVFELRENFYLEDYTKRFILEDANFRMMGSNDFGHPVFYYHILMVVDQQSFEDGTLLHVDFNRSGDPALSFRYPAIRSFFPWKWHHDSPDVKLGDVNEYFHESGIELLGQGMDLTRPVVDILVEEMALRGVSAEEGGNLRHLAIEAVYTVNEQLLRT
ncbi:hypothetical protein EV426DRAFT_262199 [Tirmania nivea]|nr:hypothetical protein EV426DRAFT_262199 [Tirmania nivea]